MIFRFSSKRRRFDCDNDEDGDDSSFVVVFVVVEDDDGVVVLRDTAAAALFVAMGRTHVKPVEARTTNDDANMKKCRLLRCCLRWQ